MDHGLRGLHIPAAFAAGVVLCSCAIFTPAMKFGVLEMTTETLKNGYLIQIKADRPVGTVGAVVTSGNWLLVTFADSLLDADALEEFRSEFIDSVEITHFSSALQLALHLTVAVGSVEVIHVDPSREVLISLFSLEGKMGEASENHGRDGAIRRRTSVDTRKSELSLVRNVNS